MSDPIDTSADVVGRLADLLEGEQSWSLRFKRSADTLRALLAERDVERQIANEMKAERDAAQAEAARLRELLRDVTDALEPHVPTNAKHREPYEHPLSAYDRARDALARAAKAERDRAEVEAYYGQAKREVAEAEAKAARLREALTKIAARDPNAVGSGKRAIEYDLMRYEARAALAKES